MENFDNVGNNGERMTADNYIWSYYAHLSIYRFALPHIQGMNVLDAGCGTGYGTAYLKNNGASSVEACDGGDEAVKYCKHRYVGSGINFQTVDLCGVMPYSDNSFDVIFSSNVMEHLSDIDMFMSECLRVLKPNGKMIIAVPPVHSPAALVVNIENIFHVTNLTPFGWHTKISRFFKDVSSFLHRPTGVWSDPAVNSKEVHLPAEQTSIRETDFEFLNVPIDILNSEPNNITAAYIATKPRSSPLKPSLDELIPYDWFEGTLVAGVIRDVNAHASGLERTNAKLNSVIADLERINRGATEKIEQVNRELQELKQELSNEKQKFSDILASTSWQITSPIRMIKRMLSLQLSRR